MKKIKIFHIVYIFDLGGIESFIIQLCNNMDTSKYDIYVITLANEELNQIHLLKNSVRVISLPFGKEFIKRPIGFFKTFFSLVKIFRKIRPDIVHSHHEHYVTFFIMLASKLSLLNMLRIRTVHSGGDIYTEQKKIVDKIKLNLEKMTLMLFKVDLIAVSKGVYNNNIKYFTETAQNNTLIPNGVDLEKFSREKLIKISRSDFEVQDNAVIFTYVSRLNPGKNHEYLIKIWPQILKEIPKAVLIFAGDGPLMKELMAMSSTFEVSNNILFLGAINNVPELLSVTDVGVFPSLYEGMSIALLEKFAMEVPVVASDIEAFRNVASDGVDSFLVNLKNEDLFVEKLVMLGLDENIRKKVGKNARDTAARFSLEKMVDAYQHYYSENIKY